MERAIGSQELNRKIVFVARDPFEFLAVAKSDDERPVSWVEIKVRRCDRLMNYFARTSARVRGKIGGEKSSFAADHVAVGAFAFAKKQFSALFWVSRKRRRKRVALKCPQIGDERMKN